MWGDTIDVITSSLKIDYVYRISGYPEAIVNELLNYRVSLAGLTETRLVNNGVQYIDTVVHFYTPAALVTSMGLPCYLTRGSQVHWYP